MSHKPSIYQSAQDFLDMNPEFTNTRLYSTVENGILPNSSDMDLCGLLYVWIASSAFIHSVDSEFATSASGLAVADHRVVFDIPAGDAVVSLSRLLQQYPIPLLYAPDELEGVGLNRVSGLFTVEEALAHLIDNTPLQLIRDSETGTWIIRNGLNQVDPSGSGAGHALLETNPTTDMETSTVPDKRTPRLLASIALGLAGFLAPAGAQETASFNEEGVYELSPFVVQTSENDIGYYAENTLAGSRLNSRISDLAASISVVTLQQLEDTSSTNINDVFLYEANTEGTGNYTDYSIDKNGAISDTAATAAGFASANRVRGIAPAETARNYFPSITRIPFDAYNTSSFEINRGPNSILFGLGNAAGIMNQSLANAMIGEQSTQLQMRVGSWEAFRTSLRLNRTVLDDKLAVLIAGLYDEAGFQRKPSYDRTSRYYANVTYKPFSKTTLRLLFENYSNSNQRPNTVTPRDLVTPWRNAGSPAWNPVERTVTMNGVTTGPYDSNAGLPNELWDEYANSPIYLYDRGQVELFTMRRLSSNPDKVDGGATPYRTKISGFHQPGPLWVAPGVTDKTIYDWEKINIQSGNFGSDKAKTMGFELDQQILPNLFLNAGWFREEFDSENSYYISQQTGATIQIDPNSHQLDGTVNPYFGRPYLEIREPDDFEEWENNDNLRASLAYDLDFTKREDKLSWLGHHRLLGLWSKREIDDGRYRWRQMVTSDNPWVIKNDLSQGAGGALYRRFYLGGADGNVAYDPGKVPNGNISVPLYRGTPTAGTIDSSPAENWNWSYEGVSTTRELHWVSNASERKIDSTAFVMQNYLLNDRIITTFGWRTDENQGRATPNLKVDPATGMSYPEDVGKTWGDWQKISGDTRTTGIVVKPLNWLFFHYNESDNFQPAGVSYDINDGSFLPLPNGEGKDYGFTVELEKGKLYARMNWFETSQNDTRAGPTGTFIWRMGYYDAEAFYDWAVLAARYEGLTGAAADARIKAITQLPDNFEDYRNNVVGSSDVVAKGMEFNLIYNPINNWSIKLNVARQETVYDNIAGQYDQWRATRLPIWMNAHSDAMPEGYRDFWTYDNFTAPDTIRRIGVIGGASTRTPELWFNINVDAPMALQKKLEGKVSPSQREWRWNMITNYVFDEGRLKGFGLGGSVRWEDEAAIGYLAGAADPDGVVRQLDPDRPVFDDAQFHVDLWCSYQMQLLNDKLGLKLQLNVRDALENGGLQPIGVNPDGSPSAFRIQTPRQFFLSATFDF